MDQTEPDSAIDKISKTDITESKGTATKTLTADNPENTGGELLNDASPVMQIPCEEIPCDEGRLQQQNRAANRKMSETEFPSKINQTEEFKKEAEQKLEQVPENMHMDQKNFTILKQASHDSSVDYGDLERGKPSDTQSEGGKGDAAAEKCSSTPDIIVPSCPRTEDHGDHTNTEQNSSRITDVEKMDETKPLAVNEDAGRGSHNDRAMKLDEKVITEDKNKSDRQKEGNSMKEDSHRQEMSKGISVLEIDPPHVTRKIENKEMKNAQLSSCEDNIFISTIDVDGNEKEKLVETNVNAISDEHINVQNNNASGGRVGEAHLSDVHLNLSKYYEFHYADKETLVNNHPDPNNNYGSESLHKEQPSDKANHESTQFMMGSRELDLRTEKLEKYIDSNERSEVLQKINAKENQIVQKNLNNQNYEPNSEEGESIVNQSSMNEENLHNLLLDEVPIQHNMDKSEMHPELRIEKKESVKGNANKNEETEKMASTIKQNEGPEMLCAKQGYEILEKDIASGKFLIPVTGKDSFEEGDTETHVCTSCTSLKDIVDSHSDKNENRKEDSKDRSEDTRQEREREDLLDQKVTTESMQEAKAAQTDDWNKETEVSNANNDIISHETVADSSDTTNLESDGVYSMDKKVDGGRGNTLSSEQMQKARDVSEPIDENCSISHLYKEDQTPSATLSEKPQNSIDGERNKVNSNSGKDVSAGHDSSSESPYICKSQDKAEAEQQANTNFTNDGNDDFEGLSAHTQEEKEKREVDGEAADQLYAKDECNNNNDKETSVDGKNTKCSILEHQNSKTIAVSQDVVVSNIFLEKNREDKLVENSNAVPANPEDVVIKQEMHSPMENPQDLKLDKEPPDSPTVEVEIAASTDPVMDNPDTCHKNQGQIVKINEQIFIGKGETENKTEGNEGETESEGISSKTQTNHEVSGRLSLNEAALESLPEKESEDGRCKKNEMPKKDESTTFQEKEPLDNKLEDQHGSESGTVSSRLILNEVVSESLAEKDDDGRRSDLPDEVPVEDENVTFQERVLPDNKMNEEPVPDTVVHSSTSAIKQNDVTESDMEPQEKNQLDSSCDMSEAKESINEVQRKSFDVLYIEKEWVERHVTANSCDKLDKETHSSTAEGTPDNYLLREKDHHEMSASCERVEEQTSASTPTGVKGKEAEANYTVKSENNEQMRNGHEQPLEQDDSIKDSTEVITLIAKDVKPGNYTIISTDTKEATTASSGTTVQQETANHEETSTSSEIECGVITPAKKEVQFAAHTTECEEGSTELVKLQSLISGVLIDDITDDMDQKEETVNKSSNAQITSWVAEAGEQRDDQEKDQAASITVMQQMEETAVNPDNDVKDQETLPVPISSQAAKEDLHVVETTGKPWEDLEILKPSDPQNNNIVEDLPVSEFLLDQILRGNSLEEASVPHGKAEANEDTNTNENNTNGPGKEATEELKAETRIPNNDTEFLEKTEKDSSPPLKQGTCNATEKANNGQKDADMDVEELESQFSAKQVNKHANNEESLHSLYEESKDVLNVDNEKEQVIKAKTPEKVPSCAIPTDELNVHTVKADNDKETLEMSEINSQQPLKQTVQNMTDEVKDGQGDTETHGEVIRSPFFAKEAHEHPKDQEGSHIVTKESKGYCQANDTMLSTMKASNPGVDEAAKEVFILRQASDGPGDATIVEEAPNFKTREHGNSLTRNLDITMTTKLLKEVVTQNKDGQSIRETKEVQPNVEIPEKKLIEFGATAVTESVMIQGAQAFVRHEEALESIPHRQEAYPQSSAVEDRRYGVAPGDESEEKDAELLECKQTASREFSVTENKTSNIDARESQPYELYPPSMHQEPLTNMPADSEDITEKEMIAAKKEKLVSQIDSPMDEKKSVSEKNKENIMDQKMEEDKAESLLMEEFRGLDLKQQQKKHHSILSGVGSKVKHSILTKVKKAITCTSVELPK